MEVAVDMYGKSWRRIRVYDGKGFRVWVKMARTRVCDGGRGERLN